MLTIFLSKSFKPLNKPTRLQEGGPSVRPPWCNYEHTDTGRNDLSPPRVHVYLVLNDPPLDSLAVSCGKILYNSYKGFIRLPFILCTKNPREDSPADESTYLCALQSLLYVSVRIPFRPRCFFVVASLNVLNHKALSYKFFEFPTTAIPTAILHCKMSTNSPKG